MKWIVVCISLFMAVGLTTDASIAGGSQASALKSNPEASAFLQKAFGGSRPQLIRASYSGNCGGWIRDAEGECHACTNDQRPTCDDDGNCQCDFDKYCYDLCTDAGTCDGGSSGC